jgi:radical SAM superfamily enzyme YgiQ (UPF0313 family)
MRVVLLYPEVYDIARFKERRKEFPPFGVLYLAAAIEQAGHSVAIERVTPHRTALHLSSYDAVGFSLASSATYGLMLKARKLSSIRNDALVMVGGVHCNLYPADSLRDFAADVASVGDAEETIAKILLCADSRCFDHLPGVVSRDSGAEVRPRHVGRLDRVPLPARHLLPTADFVMSDRLADTDTRITHVMFSRGCPFGCRFCASGQTEIQYRGARSVREELVQLIDRYAINGFAIVDDNFVVHKPSVAEICRQIGDLGLRWSALSRVDTIDEPILRMLASAGCIEIKFGMESGSELMLRKMGKNISREQIKVAVTAASRLKMTTNVFVIHGFPGENLDTTKATIDLLDELGSAISRISLFRFVPLPGSEVYRQADKYGIRGTHLQPNWNGDWRRFRIHHNNRHWWGTDDQWAETQEAYQRLLAFVESRWNRQR